MAKKRIEQHRGGKYIKKVVPEPAHHHKKNESFALYIYKVLKDIQTNKQAKGINKKAMVIMNNMVYDIFDQMSLISAQLIRYNKKHTLTSKEIEASVKLLFPVDLALHAIQEGRKAVDKFAHSERKK